MEMSASAEVNATFMDDLEEQSMEDAIREQQERLPEAREQLGRLRGAKRRRAGTPLEEPQDDSEAEPSASSSGGAKVAAAPVAAAAAAALPAFDRNGRGCPEVRCTRRIWIGAVALGALCCVYRATRSVTAGSEAWSVQEQGSMVLAGAGGLQAAARGGLAESRWPAPAPVEPAAADLAPETADNDSDGQADLETEEVVIPGPSVAYLILGYEDSTRPVWSSKSDDMYIFVPPALCPGCPDYANKSLASGPYLNAPETWWCTQRTYLMALSEFLIQFPDKDYYFLVDANTVVFPRALKTMMSHLDAHILGPHEDLYMGHGFTLENYPDVGLGRFIQSGGGVLLRGLTLRRLASSGTLSECIEEVYNGTWCWHHCDWILGECLRAINVFPQGHPSMQQHKDFCWEYPEPWRCCHEAAVGCHPVDLGEPMRQMVKMHAEYLEGNPDALADPGWARPCADDAYEWRWRGWSVVSICREWAYESPNFLNFRRGIGKPAAFSD